MKIFKRVTIAMKKTWRLGERLFRNDYKRKVKMFDTLVSNVVLYGAEIWGWKNEARLDRMKIRQVDIRFGQENTELYSSGRD